MNLGQLNGIEIDSGKYRFLKFTRAEPEDNGTSKYFYFRCDVIIGILEMIHKEKIFCGIATPMGCYPVAESMDDVLETMMSIEQKYTLRNKEKKKNESES